METPETITTIDITPVGVRQDPERVNKAIAALDHANAACADALHELLEMLDSGDELNTADAWAAHAARMHAQAEFLKSLTGKS